jgi:hypothetical protein
MNEPPSTCPHCGAGESISPRSYVCRTEKSYRSRDCYERTEATLRAELAEAKEDVEKTDASARKILEIIGANSIAEQNPKLTVDEVCETVVRTLLRLRNSELECDSLRQQLLTAQSREATLRGALTKAHPAEIWDKARMYYTHETSFKGPNPILQWHADLCKAVDAALASDGKGGAA